MRIRSTKPEFWRSKTIASVDWEARLVLKGVESYVDDNGVGKDDVVLIAADVFPHDLANDRDTLARISGALARLSEAGLLARYDVGGEALIYVRHWKSVQRVDKPNKGRYPRPDGSMEYEDDVDESVAAGQSPAPAPRSRDTRARPRDSVATPSRTLAPGTEEQGNRGAEKNTAGDDAGPTFAEFYAAYPKKEARRAAERAWNAAVKRASPETIMAGLRRYRFRSDRQFIPQPATWLNGDRWADGESTPTADGSPVAVSLSRQEIDEILGTDSWQLPHPPMDPEEDPAGYRAWCQKTTEEHRAERVSLALAQLARR